MVVNLKKKTVEGSGKLLVLKVLLQLHQWNSE